MPNIAESVRKWWKNKKTSKVFHVWALALLVFCLELAVKTYLRQQFAFQSIPLIKNILHITVVFNTGAAFGFLQGKTGLLALLGIAFLVVFTLAIRRESHKTGMFIFACGLILGGALSNLYDRIFLGFVVDYIDLRVWPVFNVADSCISIGAALLIIQSFTHHEKHTTRLTR